MKFSSIQNKIADVIIVCGIIAGIFLFIFTEYKVQGFLAFLTLSLAAMKANWAYLDPNYKNSRKKGTEVFDYTHNGGNYEIGKEKLRFRLNFANGDASHIWFNKPSAGIKDIGLANGIYSIEDIRNADSFFKNSTNITVAEEEIVVIKNVHDNYAAIKIIDVKATTHHDPINQITFEYVINPGKVSDFGF